MKTILTLTKTSASNPDALTTAQRITPAQSWHPRAGQWDLFAVVGLMVCSAAYGICAIAGVAGF